MLTFFRRIRKSLLASDAARKPASPARLNGLLSGRAGRYIFYAIGEITLVVIGILIALQVNNWNEALKGQAQEKMVLNEILANVQIDLEDFKSNIAHLENTIISSKSTIAAIQTKQSYHDSLAFYFYYVGFFPHFTPNISGYEFLKSKGLEIISNDSIRQEISTLYENHYKTIHILEEERIEYNLQYLNPKRIKYLGSSSVSDELIPSTLKSGTFFNLMMNYGAVRELVNFKGFIKDRELFNIIKDIEVHAKLNLEVHSFVKKDIDELIIQIKNEI